MRVGLLGDSDRLVLARAASESTDTGAATLAAVRSLRESMYALLVAWGDGRRPARPDLDRLNDLLAAAPRRDRLDWPAAGPVWPRAPRIELIAPAWPVAWSAADLLTSGDPDRLRQCAGPGCGWLFYDQSRGGRRRWCSMEDCGNRAKAQRHQARLRARTDATGA